ncbi:hypothetical protein K502DRAFT_346134 [Neoconidiobolus thromboides FSU 785]|nr:hypothetical protein K502DRAFT_346134 [Neoconidiobolus thromboides FSU 785]
MSLKLDLLSDLLLEEIFKLLDPVELLELRFLSKYLHVIASRVIEYNLSYSVYNQEEFQQYRYYQEKFIEENGILMKHININENVKYDDLKLLNYCPNLVSIYFEARLFYYSLDNNNKINIIFPKLKRFTIKLGTTLQPLDILKKHLYQSEAVEFLGDVLSFDTITNYLNPNILKSLKINYNCNLHLNGLDVIKEKFNNLRVLCLKSKRAIVTVSNIVPNINFASNLELEIEGELHNDCNNAFNIRCFGDLRKFKSIKLIDVNKSYFNMNDKDNNIELMKDSNVVSLGFFSKCGRINYDFIKLSTLKEIKIDYFSKELLYSISLSLNIQTIYVDIVSFCFIKEFNQPDLINNEECDQEYKAIQCKSIKQIEINKFNSYFNELYCLSLLFPNLEKVKIKDFKLTAKNENINFNLAYSLLLVTSVKVKKSIYYNELENNPKINWICI